MTFEMLTAPVGDRADFVRPPRLELGLRDVLRAVYKKRSGRTTEQTPGARRTGGRLGDETSRQADVLRGLDLGRRRSAEDIQRQLLDAYQAHGSDAPSDYSRWSRVLAAGTARQGTRTLRLLWEAVVGLRALAGWLEANVAATSNSDEDQLATWHIETQRDNTVELSQLRRTVLGCVALSAAAAAGAYLTKGITRATLVALAAVLTALSGWVGLWAVGIGFLIRHTRPPR